MRQIERNPIIDDSVDRVVLAIGRLNRQDMISLEEIESITGMERYTESWHSVIRKVKRRVLRERGIELWSVHGRGYELSSAADQMDRNIHARLRRAKNQSRHAEKALQHLPPRELDSHGQIMRASRLGAIKRLQGDIAAEITQIDVISHVPDSMPMPFVGRNG